MFYSKTCVKRPLKNRQNNILLTKGIIKQGDSNSDVIICSGTKFKLPVDLRQLLILELPYVTAINCLWNSSLMKVESIAECFKGSILQYF